MHVLTFRMFRQNEKPPTQHPDPGVVTFLKQTFKEALANFSEFPFTPRDRLLTVSINQFLFKLPVVL